MKAKEKPAYQSPKVSRLDYNETVIGGEDEAGVTCSTGSNAIGECLANGNIPALGCDSNGNGEVEGGDG